MQLVAPSVGVVDEKPVGQVLCSTLSYIVAYHNYYTIEVVTFKGALYLYGSL